MSDKAIIPAPARIVPAAVTPVEAGDFGSFASGGSLTIAALSMPFQFLLALGLNVLLAMDRIRQLNFMDAMAPALALRNAVVVLLILHSRLKMLVTFNTAATIALSAVMLWVIARLIARQ